MPLLVPVLLRHVLKFWRESFLHLFGARFRRVEEKQSNGTGPAPMGSESEILSYGDHELVQR